MFYDFVDNITSADYLAAMELLDGRIITGKTSDLLGSSAALLLNALKDLSGIEHDGRLGN